MFFSLRTSRVRSLSNDSKFVRPCGKNEWILLASGFSLLRLLLSISQGNVSAWVYHRIHLLVIHFEPRFKKKYELKEKRILFYIHIPTANLSKNLQSISFCEWKHHEGWDIKASYGIKSISQKKGNRIKTFMGKYHPA